MGKKIELTRDEVVILKNFDKKYKYIARDRDRSLHVYEVEPMKSDIYYEYLTRGGTKSEYLFAFNHLFQNITFESGAHLIADLINKKYDEGHKEGYKRGYEDGWDHAIEFAKEHYGTKDEEEEEEDVWYDQKTLEDSKKVYYVIIQERK